MSANGANLGDQDCETFSFAMGEHLAVFPLDCHYATNHMWAMQRDAGRWRFGLTAYAVRLLQDVYFLDWVIEPPAAVKPHMSIGSIESKKAESGLYSPIAGELAAINDDVLMDPSLINAEPYGQGWLIEIESTSTDSLLNPTAYQQHLTDAWQVAQRTIKGQANL
ncbi:glycine cleavage system protein H [Novipirellula artificiosorum]|uniref:Glycine cleavage system H protein n=1 Tax=Novipirellula artificiosorum TaxID=2528016 RepID=A0A5C6DM98_9BACT|nr:glycine cleavage system protein H [Novipirellula artificiosorum]TWU37264.1 Glycine cleavage system H protein [Novipirellula artificiosorum]